MQINPMKMAMSIVAIIGLLIIGSAWFFGSNLKTPGYIHHTPEQGLHPRDKLPFALPQWNGLLADPKQSIGHDFETVEFLAVDGTTLRGWLIRSKNNNGKTQAVVAVHGGESDRRSWLRHSPFLLNAGYSVLLFDMREHGISDGAARGIAFGWRANYDVSSAVAFMKKQHAFDRVAVMGTSMGAVSAIIAAAKDKTIDAVIAENPFASAVDVLADADFFDQLPRWYLVLVAHFNRQHFSVLEEPNAIDVVTDIAPRPLLLMHGTEDQSVSLWQSQALFDAAKQPKSLWILEGAGHTTLYNHDPQQFEKKVLSFLEQHL